MFAVGSVVCFLAVGTFGGTVGPSCNNSIKLVSNEVYEGDTSGFPEAKVQCRAYTFRPKGMWFHYKGEGYVVILDTCDERTTLDSVIFVFSSCETDKDGYINQCVDYNIHGCNNKKSRVMFAAEEDKDYYIFVGGYLSSTGVFYLNTSLVIPPKNYQCQKAIDVDHLPYVIEDDTETCSNVNDPCQQKEAAGRKALEILSLHTLAVRTQSMVASSL